MPVAAGAIHVLSRLFQRLFLWRLHAAYAGGRLRFSGTLDGIGQAHAFTAAIRQLRRNNWIVYAKPPFGSPEQVLAYLGRYIYIMASSPMDAVPTRHVIIRQLAVAMKAAPTAAAGETTKEAPAL
ncbi:transposase [Aminobacter sp. BA135]